MVRHVIISLKLKGTVRGRHKQTPVRCALGWTGKQTWRGRSTQHSLPWRRWQRLAILFRVDHPLWSWRKARSSDRSIVCRHRLRSTRKYSSECFQAFYTRKTMRCFFLEPQLTQSKINWEFEVNQNWLKDTRYPPTYQFFSDAVSIGFFHLFLTILLSLTHPIFTWIEI